MVPTRTASRDDKEFVTYKPMYTVPRTQLTSIFEGQPSKTKPFPSKTRGPILGSYGKHTSEFIGYNWRGFMSHLIFPVQVRRIRNSLHGSSMINLKLILSLDLDFQRLPSGITNIAGWKMDPHFSIGSIHLHSKGPKIPASYVSKTRGFFHPPRVQLCQPKMPPFSPRERNINPSHQLWGSMFF